MEQEQELAMLENFRNQMQMCMSYCKQAKDTIMNNSNDEAKCLAKLMMAIHYLSVGKSLYYTYSEFLWRPTLDELMHKFDVFLGEITNNINTSHSHQWTDIEYQNLASCFDYSEVNSQIVHYSE